MANIQISSPFLRAFTHNDVSVGTTPAIWLDAAVSPERRIIVIVQNQSTSASIEVIFNSAGNQGLYVPPLGNISIDNYTGIVRIFASAAATPVHIAYATA